MYVVVSRPNVASFVRIALVRLLPPRPPHLPPHALPRSHPFPFRSHPLLPTSFPPPSFTPATSHHSTFTLDTISSLPSQFTGSSRKSISSSQLCGAETQVSSGKKMGARSSMSTTGTSSCPGTSCGRGGEGEADEAQDAGARGG